MLRWLPLLGIVCIVASASAQETTVHVRKLMTVEEFNAAGLQKLTAAELDALDRWVTEHGVNVYRFAQGGNASAKSGGRGYLVEAVVADETFIINGNVYKAKVYCLTLERGDRVLLAEGSPSGVCVSAKLVNLRNGDVCNVWCE